MERDAFLAFLASAGAPHDAASFALFALAVLAASLVSEDLTCVGVGLLVGAGRVDLASGVGAAAFALWAGDLLLYAAGRTLGPAVLRRRPFARALAGGGLARAESQLRGSGPLLILAARFVPGARLPTYVAAGVLRYPLARFSLWLAAGAALWAPVLVGVAAGVGGAALARFRAHAAPIAIATALGVALLARLAPRLVTWRGRRLLLGAWRRFRRWEFWPIWRVYLGVAPTLAWLAWRHGGFRVVTAVNPAMPSGGLLGEGKREILEALSHAAPELVAPWRFVAAGRPAAERADAVRAFLREIGVTFPVVLKPDVGERGAGVAIVRDDAALDAHFAAHAEDVIAQRHVPGVELGVFWLRHPSQPHGTLFSITEKRMLAVTGDGRATLETLILRDPRAVCLAPVHLARHAHQLARVPAAGERVPLVEIGTHSRGALFLDGNALATPALADAIERVSRGYPGFCFGRYDVRGESIEAIQAGRLQIVELNGLTAEATHIYDPRHDVRYARRVLRTQWRIAFEIGAANAAAGARVSTLGELVALWRARRRAGAGLAPV
jgi:membrane protein DedA with SNARE-associated domain